MSDDVETTVECPRCVLDSRSEPDPNCQVCNGTGRARVRVAAKYRASLRKNSTQTIYMPVACPACDQCAVCKGKHLIPLSEATAYHFANAQKERDTIPAPPPKTEEE